MCDLPFFPDDVPNKFQTQGLLIHCRYFVNATNTKLLINCIRTLVEKRPAKNTSWVYETESGIPLYAFRLQNVSLVCSVTISAYIPSKSWVPAFSTQIKLNHSKIQDVHKKSKVWSNFWWTDSNELPRKDPTPFKCLHWLRPGSQEFLFVGQPLDAFLIHV